MQNGYRGAGADAGNGGTVKHERAINLLAIAANAARSNRAYHESFGTMETAQQQAMIEAEMREAIAVLQKDGKQICEACTKKGTPS